MTKTLEAVRTDFAKAGENLKEATRELRKAADKATDPAAEVVVNACDRISDAYDGLVSQLTTKKPTRTTIPANSMTHSSINRTAHTKSSVNQEKSEAAIQKFDKDANKQLAKIPQTSMFKKYCNAIAKCIKAVVAAASRFVAYIFRPITAFFKTKKSAAVKPVHLQPDVEFRRGKKPSKGR
jgi:hypothetical protein